MEQANFHFYLVLFSDNFFNDNKLDKKKIAKLQNSPENLINDQYFEKISLFNFDEHVLTDKALIKF